MASKFRQLGRQWRHLEPQDPPTLPPRGLRKLERGSHFSILFPNWPPRRPKTDFGPNFHEIRTDLGAMLGQLGFVLKVKIRSADPSQSVYVSVPTCHGSVPKSVTDPSQNVADSSRSGGRDARSRKRKQRKQRKQRKRKRTLWRQVRPKSKRPGITYAVWG